MCWTEAERIPPHIIQYMIIIAYFFMLWLKYTSIKPIVASRSVTIVMGSPRTDAKNARRGTQFNVVKTGIKESEKS